MEWFTFDQRIKRIHPAVVEKQFKYFCLGYVREKLRRGGCAKFFANCNNSSIYALCILFPGIATTATLSQLLSATIHGINSPRNVLIRIQCWRHAVDEGRKGSRKLGWTWAIWDESWVWTLFTVRYTCFILMYFVARLTCLNLPVIVLTSPTSGFVSTCSHVEGEDPSFRLMLWRLKPNSRMPVDYCKAFLMMWEMVFVCIVSVWIDWLFCNFCTSVSCNPQFLT
jgi:hypothetical protein